MRAQEGTAGEALAMVTAPMAAGGELAEVEPVTVGGELAAMTAPLAAGGELVEVVAPVATDDPLATMTAPLAASGEPAAVELRKQGLSFREIGARLGMTDGEAWRQVEAALQALPPPAGAAAELRQLEAERLDLVLALLHPRVVAGELAAVDRWVAVCARRARLLGLDQPPRLAEPPATGPLEVVVRYVES